ncbi:hypothetical protein O6H91_01G078100 [Diphasiastrum complanatum]|nr:hypothetical protein O6H91_01G078100 [Diphasiastrum complanatum]KAJ7569442.1 hypothetical protein O6H91_01G078100 [Diphasiastrum complanatum]
MFISVECSPTAAPEFEGKGGEDTNLELAKALQRNFLGGASGAGAAIDLTTLIVIEGKVCWELYIDGLVLSSDGNILDALSIAVKAALSNTGIPKVQVMGGLSLEEADFELSDNPEEFSHLDTAQVPVTVTISKVGRYHIVDATAEEESQVSSAVSVAVNSKGLICGLTKSGTAGLDPSILMDMISVGKRVGLKTISSVETDIAAAERTLEAE